MLCYLLNCLCSTFETVESDPEQTSKFNIRQCSILPYQLWPIYILSFLAKAAFFYFAQLMVYQIYCLSRFCQFLLPLEKALRICVLFWNLSVTYSFWNLHQCLEKLMLIWSIQGHFSPTKIYIFMAQTPPFPWYAMHKYYVHFPRFCQWRNLINTSGNIWSWCYYWDQKENSRLRGKVQTLRWNRPEGDDRTDNSCELTRHICDYYYSL